MMRLRFGSIGKVLLILVFLTSGLSCAKKTVPTQPEFGAGGAGGDLGDGAGGSSGAGGIGGGSGGGLGPGDGKWKELGINSEQEKREFLEKAQAFQNEDIYFDFDSHTLSAPAKKVLDGKAAFLKRYAKVRVTVEGHCDERGTTEYNLALGERRATSAVQYLTHSGIPQARLSTISYGKERPLANAHDEASWAKNRRDHFTLNY